ncbi:DUF943 family protein [Yersinia pseudotuberculosis]|uniref:DUF943 family protein n=1 Tax=Yersinia pseudotuberculosis TaxID=633 RepID=UPI0005E0917E|nr:DUF943 family protein [Yersinia pseudotuberculosis]CNK68929.1 putative entero membrane protein [Yersinia pseudotuberculosis]
MKNSKHKILLGMFAVGALYTAWEITRPVKILDAGDGYKLNLPKRDVFFPDSDTSHLICFEEMKVAENCIDKNWVMDIEKIRDNRIFFSMGNSSYQQPVEGGEITKNAED